ncbi:MAG: phasin family protein [Litorimonas sp.]
MAKTPSDKDTIRKIWLAGIGAYGRAVTEAKGAVDTLAGKGSEVFDELVQKGEMLETVGKYKANELVGKGKAAVEDITPDFEIDDRIAKMRARLSGAAEKRDDRLAARVDQLEAKLDAILDKLDIGEAAPKKKSPARKTKPASKTKMTTQRTTAKKSATKKSTTKK